MEDDKKMFVFLFVCLEPCAIDSNPTIMCLCFYLHDTVWHGMVCVYVYVRLDENLLPWKSWLKTECKNEIAAMKSVCFRHMPTQNRQSLTQFFYYGIRVVTTGIQNKPKEEGIAFHIVNLFIILRSFLSYLLFLCRSICEYFSKPFASTSFRHHILGHTSSSFDTCFAISLLYFSCSLSYTPSLTTAKVCR